MLKKILCLLIASVFFMQVVYSADINDWIRGTGVDVVEGGETISTLDDVITNYLQDPLDRLLINYVRGCTITVTDDEVLTISAGEVTTTTAGGVHRMRRNPSTATVDNTAADVGGLDTGSVAASTWYGVFAIADADATTFTLILSTSFTNPTNGAALYYRLIGCALTDGTADWLKAYYTGNGNIVAVIWDIPISVGTTTGDLDCSGAMPSISTLGIFGLTLTKTNENGAISIKAKGQTWDTGLENTLALYTVGHTGGNVSGQRICATDSSQDITVTDVVAVASRAIDVEGFIFVR